MAWIMNQLPAHDVTFDVSTNPLYILLTREEEQDEADILESQFLAGTYVTQPKQSNYEE